MLFLSQIMTQVEEKAQVCAYLGLGDWSWLLFSYEIVSLLYQKQSFDQAQTLLLAA